VTPIAKINVNLSHPGEPISPLLHGLFIEHLGTCIEGGLWVGVDSPISNVDGLRLDVLEALQKVQPPVIRWPGGCFADAYNWRDGVGPPETRPRRVTTRWGADEVDTNAFGTHEFMKVCRYLGAEPWFSGNVGSGSPSELAAWVEYCNFRGETALTCLRAENGSDEPFEVRFWGIGNESWDCGGKFSARSYAQEYRRFESRFPRFTSQFPFLIACGPDLNKPHERAVWTRSVLEELFSWRRPALHGFDAHFYTWNTGEGTATSYTKGQWYALLEKSAEIEAIIVEQRAILDEFDPSIGLIIGEWGTWHPLIPEVPVLWQQNSLRDALSAALTLDIFQRHANKLVMANLAQAVNVLQALILTDGEKILCTPTYHVFELYRSHRGGASLEVTFEINDLVFSEAGRNSCLPGLSGSASLKDGVLTLSVVNPHADASVEAVLALKGGRVIGTPSAAVVTHEDLNAFNTFEEPELVVPRTSKTFWRAKDWHHVFPPASVTVITVPVGVEVQR